jgi:predicted Zn-dependent peptidase
MTHKHSPYHFATLSNGTGIVSRPMPHAQSVAVGLWVHAGGRYEPPQLAGVSHFLEHLLFKGTRRRSCEALKQEIEGVGGTLNGFTAEEFTCYMAKVPQRYARRALAVLTDMVRHPTLTPRDVDKEREVILEEIRMYEDSPGQLIHDLFNQLLWPDHPLGRLLSGTIDSVRRISRADVVHYWRRLYQPRSLLIACAGAMSPEALIQQARWQLSTLKPLPIRRFARAPRPRRGPQVRVWKKETEQVHLCAGTYALPRTHPDRFALELLHVVLGANMSSRLFREVREKRGLAYEVATHIKRFHDTGAFVVSAGCDAGKLPTTVQTIFTELGRIARRPIARAELRRAKDYYTGQLIMGLEDTMDHMLWMGEQAVTVGRVARPEQLLAHLAKVGVRDIQRVARQLFVSPRMHLAVVGPLAEPEMSRLSAMCTL